MSLPTLRVCQCSFQPQLVVLSYCISWLGAYTCTQIIIHAKYTRNPWVKFFWTLLASLAFGFCAIWSMHFVGMLACSLDVKIEYDLTLTILSAVVAVVFTFAALYSADVMRSIGSSSFLQWLAAGLRVVHDCILSCCPERDPEAGYEALQTEEDELPPESVEELYERENGEGEYDYDEDDDREAVLERRSTEAHDSSPEVPGALQMPPLVPPVAYSVPRHGRTMSSPSSRRLSTQNQGRSTTLRSPPLARQRSHPPATRLTSYSLGRESSSMIPSLTSFDSSFKQQRTNSGSNLSGTTLASSSSSGAQSPSWGENLHVCLSRETRLRIKARTKERPIPKFGWRYWIKAHYKTITVLVVVRAAVWGMALVLMHYCGMWAMDIPDGLISWDLGIVVLSYVVAFTVCLVACITMEHMEVHFWRQFAFSTIAALGVCSMHYTGMAAATFYSHAPPAPPGESGYPEFLPITILGVAVLVCVITNVVLAHSAIIARNRMAEMILTKRRLWRIMAEKEAAEQANELKQQFISVASHEIRTPLHTVNGYCELLSRTSLTDEQEMYVSSIQQACHAINVIAGNVLDFSKLDRNNVELSARPVLTQVRKIVDDLAKIHPGQPGVEVIISVAADVPKLAFLDETYMFRVLMNLLSNAQKFCEKGFVCLAITMAKPGQLKIQVRDTGCGIPTSFRDALFQPFRQADTSLTHSRQGTGLGLSIVKHLVQRMNGTIDVESTEGEGSVFTVMLPIALDSHVQESPRIDEIPLLNLNAEPPVPLSSHRRIRIVYSNSRTEALYAELWTQHGHATSRGLPESSVAEVAQNVDAIWTDVESVACSSLLRALLRVETDRALPVYVMHSEMRELAVLEPDVSEARNAVLVKRPVILHALREMVDAPEQFMGAHIAKEPPKVRFAVSAEEMGSMMAKEKAKAKEGAPATVEDLEEIELVPKVIVPERHKVLLVEDNMINQRLGYKLLEKLGYEAVTANDGQQALDAITKTTFYACLMDCQMPILDGFVATRRIREMEKEGVLAGHLPVIALTANVTSESEERCREVGMDHFLPKPLVMPALDEALKSQGRIQPPHG